MVNDSQEDTMANTKETPSNQPKEIWTESELAEYRVPSASLPNRRAEQGAGLGDDGGPPSL